MESVQEKPWTLENEARRRSYPDSQPITSPTKMTTFSRLRQRLAHCRMMEWAGLGKSRRTVRWNPMAPTILELT